MSLAEVDNQAFLASVADAVLAFSHTLVPVVMPGRDDQVAVVLGLASRPTSWAPWARQGPPVDPPRAADRRRRTVRDFTRPDFNPERGDKVTGLNDIAVAALIVIESMDDCARVLAASRIAPESFSRRGSRVRGHLAAAVARHDGQGRRQRDQHPGSAPPGGRRRARRRHRSREARAGSLSMTDALPPAPPVTSSCTAAIRPTCASSTICSARSTAMLRCSSAEWRTATSPERGSCRITASSRRAPARSPSDPDDELWDGWRRGIPAPRPRDPDERRACGDRRAARPLADALREWRVDASTADRETVLAVTETLLRTLRTISATRRRPSCRSLRGR